jgi:hypothetical protein
VDDRRNPFGGAEPQYRHVERFGHRVAVEGEDVERVSGQGEAAIFAGTGVEHMQQQSLALCDLDRVAVAEHGAVDRECSVVNFEPARFSGGQGCGHRCFTLFPHLGNWLACWEIGGHIAAPAEGGFESLEGQEYFLVVGAGVSFRPD